MAWHQVTTFFVLWQILCHFTTQVKADGEGILGAGKWLYRPTCAHSCRRLIINSDLVCDDEAEAHSSGSHSHSSSSPSTECFLTNTPFLRTTALCLSTHCARDDVPLSSLQKYWEGNLATGTLSDYSLEPAISYTVALEDAQAEADSRDLSYLVLGEELNQTMLIQEDDFVMWYNYQKGFEYGEVDHGRNSIAVTTTAVGIPILVSLSALLPYRFISRIANSLDQPLLGHSHRTPYLRSGTMPTRAQSLFFAYLVIVNIILMCLPLRLLQPNARLPSTYQNMLQVISDRAGVLAAANLVPLLLTSSRNNILLWLTNWSHTTFLLVHRWLGYIVILQTVVHSIGLLHYYLLYSDHTAESQLPYWYWGIISTLAICLVWPLSVLPVRQQAYEIFLISHQILAALALVAYFLHIWYLFQYNWGYEIWVYIAGAIWFVDRLLRIMRIARHGTRTAYITALAQDSELLKVEIPGIYAEGHAYLYLPTLSWRFWENHPFSVLGSFSSESVADSTPSAENTSESSSADEKSATTNTARIPIHNGTSNDSSPARVPAHPVPVPKTTFLLRPQTGLTLNLLHRTRANNGSLALPVWIESSYHAQSMHRLKRCSTLICIAGGVGITAILPILRSHAGSGREARLYWAVKHNDIVDALSNELRTLERGGVRVEIKTGERLEVQGIVGGEILNGEDAIRGQGVAGDVGIVVCGPPGMADDVRFAVGKVSKRSKRAVVFVDEAFSW